MKLLGLKRINNISILFIFLSVIIFESCASKPALDPIENQTEINIIELLRNDFRTKKISNDDYYLYLTYAIFSPDSLPPNYLGSVGPKDGTPVIIEVKRAFHTLSTNNQKIIRQWIRPLPKKPKKR
jgi:hypothetical protein